MSSQGTFANQAPDSGSIRVFYQTINNKDVVKAVTVSDIDKDGDNIAISLTELDTITLPLSASGENVELIINSIKQKNGYHFLDVDDITVDSLSGSLNTPIAIAPYLTETFFYNDYNATISNAEKTRTSFLKYDVDRSGGQTKPTNYNAIAGVKTITFGDMVYKNGDGIEETTFQSIGHLATPASSASMGFITSSVIAVKDDEDFTFRINQQELAAAIGFPQTPAVIVPDSFHVNGGTLQVSSSLHLRFSSNSNFTLLSGTNASLLLADQRYENGIVNSTTFEPVVLTNNAVTVEGRLGASLRIPSGSYGGNIYMRLEQTNIFKSSNDLGQTISITPILSNNENTDDFLNVGIHRDSDEEQQPYAPKAPVQDSNYTSTGIVNARYKGTKTDENDYSGISPAIAAQPFSASLYSLNEDDNFICSQSLSDRTIESFLFIGSDENPGAGAERVGSTISSSFPSGSTDDTFKILVSDFKFGSTLSQGDVLRFTSGSNTELVQIQSAVTTSTLGQMDIQIQRRYDNAISAIVFNPGTLIDRFSDTRIFKIEDSRLIALTEKKVWVKENRTILKTSQAGYVTELSTTCTV